MKLNKLIFIWGLFSELLFAQSSSSDGLKQFEIELDPVEGAISYEVIAEDSIGKKNEFRSSKPVVSGALGCGRYRVMSRAISKAKNAGQWSEPTPFEIPLASPKKSAPNNNAEIQTNQTKTANVQLQWSPVSERGVIYTVVVVRSDNNNQVITKNVKENSLTVSLPVAVKYSWSVSSRKRNCPLENTEENWQFNLLAKPPPPPPPPKPVVEKIEPPKHILPLFDLMAAYAVVYRRYNAVTEIFNAKLNGVIFKDYRASLSTYFGKNFGIYAFYQLGQQKFPFSNEYTGETTDIDLGYSRISVGPIFKFNFGSRWAFVLKPIASIDRSKILSNAGNDVFDIDEKATLAGSQFGFLIHFQKSHLYMAAGADTALKSSPTLRKYMGYNAEFNLSRDFGNVFAMGFDYNFKYAKFGSKADFDAAVAHSIQYHGFGLFLRAIID